MEYKKLYLSILITAGAGVLFAVMSALWVGFLCFFGIALISAAVLFFIIQRQKYKQLKDKIYQRRYEDAYKFADEHGQKLDVAHFKYPRKQETEIRRQLHDGEVVYYSSILLCVFCFVVFVMICVNIF